MDMFEWEDDGLVFIEVCDCGTLNVTSMDRVEEFVLVGRVCSNCSIRGGERIKK